jgi:hypothetical protein
MYIFRERYICTSSITGCAGFARLVKLEFDLQRSREPHPRLDTLMETVLHKDHELSIEAFDA